MESLPYNVAGLIILFFLAGGYYSLRRTRLVEYDRLDPEVSTGHFAIVVPDSIRDIPAAGWAVPPFPVPASLLRRRTS